jgi:hypothetical protein
VLELCQIPLPFTEPPGLFLCALVSIADAFILHKTTTRDHELDLLTALTMSSIFETCIAKFPDTSTQLPELLECVSDQNELVSERGRCGRENQWISRAVEEAAALLTYDAVLAQHVVVNFFIYVSHHMNLCRTFSLP